MKYIIIRNENITQSMLDKLNGSSNVRPLPIYITEPDLDSGVPGVESNFSYVPSYESYPEGFKSYKKLTQEEFNSAVQIIKSGQFPDIKINENIESQTLPFSSKKLGNQKIFMRVNGTSGSVSSNASNIDFTVPYDFCKITGIEIINAEFGDVANFRVLDTPSGTISGFSNVQLNEFGTSVNITEKFYRFESSYDADLIKDMTLRVNYTSISSKTVYINFILHEVK